MDVTGSVEAARCGSAPSSSSACATSSSPSAVSSHPTRLRGTSSGPRDQPRAPLGTWADCRSRPRSRAGRGWCSSHRPWGDHGLGCRGAQRGRRGSGVWGRQHRHERHRPVPGGPLDVSAHASPPMAILGRNARNSAVRVSGHVVHGRRCPTAVWVPRVCAAVESSGCPDDYHRASGDARAGASAHEEVRDVPVRDRGPGPARPG
jgi:hypothetical protein